jgi:signal transduction histidine kinase
MEAPIEDIFAEQTVAEAVLGYLRQDAPIVLLVTDRDGQILSYNPHAREFLGPLVERNFVRDVLVDFSGRLELETLCRQSPGLLNVNTPSGMPETLHFSITSCGDRVLVMGLTEIAQQARVQREVFLLNQELGNLTRALQKSNAELARLNELKNQFLGMAAHDLRKPAGVTMNFAELLLDELANTITPEQKEFLSVILDTSREMVRLIEDFLDFSIIESGHLKLNLEMTSVARIVAEALRYQEPRARKKSVRLVVGDLDSIPALLLDEPKMVQVMGNLLGNAIDHSEPGGHVCIEGTRGQGIITLSVRDQGAGMSAEVMERLFRPFSGGRMRKQGGERSVGLGLTIARKIVEEHEGTISAESQLGQGSTFRFTLPLRERGQASS